jgi:hypothetical protein
MSSLMSDLEVTPTHPRHCPLCGTPYTCSVPFCEDLKQFICDDCSRPVELPCPNYEPLAEYMRQRREGGASINVPIPRRR